MRGQILIDSNFYIDRARRGQDPFTELAKATDDWELATCGMVMVEVLRGIKHPRVLERFKNAFEVMSFIPTSNPVWERAWMLGWEMDRSGWNIPGQDLVIAAHALYAGGAVLTADHHFHVVPGLKVLSKLD